MPNAGGYGDFAGGRPLSASAGSPSPDQAAGASFSTADGNVRVEIDSAGLVDTVVITPLAMRLDPRNLSGYLAEAMRGAQLVRIQRALETHEDAQAEYESLARDLDQMHADYVRQMEVYEDNMAEILRSQTNDR
jgi:hypothetical protein